MGVGVRKTVKNGKVKKERIITVYIPTDERYPPTNKYPEGRTKYKRVVYGLGSIYEVSKARAQEIFEREQAKHKKARYYHSPLLGEFAERYLKHKRDAEGKKSWERDRYALKALIEYFGEDTPLDEISSQEIDKYKAHRQESAAPKTINNELGVLRHLFNLAIRWEEYEGENPVSKAGLIKKIIREKREGPTSEEESQLLQVLSPNVGWIFTFCLYTGMRISEVINLEVNQIQEYDYIEDGVIKKIRMVVLNPVDTKAGKGRVIPLNANAEKALIQALEFNAGRHSRVFLNTKGEPYSSYNAVYLAMKRACKSLKIRLITPHDLRRGFASRMVESGADLLSIRAVMGHASFKMLESYATVSLSKIRGVRGIETKPLRIVKKTKSKV